MRVLLILFILLLSGAVALYQWALGVPYKRYSSWVSGQNWDRYYSITNFRQLYLAPNIMEDIPTYKEDYSQLWKEFPIRNGLVPLPTRHPLYSTVPIIELNGNKNIPDIGILINSTKGRELNRIYILPAALYPDHSSGQELFKLPFVQNILLQKKFDEIWKDLFTYKIVVKKKSIQEMIYDLYILHLRSKLLPPKTLKYGLIKNGRQALIQLDSSNKDYKVEVVLSQSNGMIFSFLLKSDNYDLDAANLRSKFLNSVVFSPADPAMAKLLYTEFKQLNFARQIEQEGMLYLYSAWTQDFENTDLIKEMIFYLERGPSNSLQLKELYNFAYKKFGKTFSTRDGNDIDDKNLDLQRKIELEQKRIRNEAESKNINSQGDLELNAKEQMNLFLKRAKERKMKKKGEMTVH